MKVKTSEATGLQLDWGLVVAHGAKHTHIDAEGVYADDACFPVHRDVFGRIKHTDPAVCMTLVKEHKITLAYWNITSVWSATPDDNGWDEHGDTPEQAVARCVIAMQLGDEFECPDELGVIE